MSKSVPEVHQRGQCEGHQDALWRGGRAIPSIHGGQRAPHAPTRPTSTFIHSMHRGACPHECHSPTDEGPAECEGQDENCQGLMMCPGLSDPVGDEVDTYPADQDEGKRAYGCV